MIHDSPGAPYGGRVHWFLILLSRDVTRRFDISYRYDLHDYCLYRKIRGKLIEVYTIKRTSLKTFRLTYHNVIFKRTAYKSFKSARKTAEFINRAVELQGADPQRRQQYAETLINVSDYMKKNIQRLKLTQTQVAENVGISQQTVGKYVNGERVPPVPVMVRITAYFHRLKRLSL